VGGLNTCGPILRQNCLSGSMLVLPAPPYTLVLVSGKRLIADFRMILESLEGIKSMPVTSMPGTVLYGSMT
jgi:hypothetical protein